MNQELRVKLIDTVTVAENNALKTQIANLRVQLEDMKLKYVQALQRENSLRSDVHELRKKEFDSLLEGKFLVQNKTIA